MSDLQCRHNNGMGDCPYIITCLARLTDRTITGCNLPFVWNGLIPKESAYVIHTVKGGDEDDNQ